MRNRVKAQQSFARNREGSILIVVLVCLGFAATVLFGALRTSLQHRRQMHNEYDAVQTEWLLDAGVRLATRKLREDDSYAGQTTTFKDDLRNDQVGVVEILVSDISTPGEGRTVQVKATLKRPGSNFGIRRSHRFNFPSSNSSSPSLGNRPKQDP